MKCNKVKDRLKNIDKNSTKIINKIASICLVTALIIQIIGSTTITIFANAYSSLGTNDALGSPILNDNFVSDDWNSWEIITWGIFLSNFTQPFIDDYNSAFNKSADYGSKGDGVRALEFGSGRDPANSTTIKDLLDYAVNMQLAQPGKEIWLSMGKLNGYEVTKANFGTQSVQSETEEIDNGDTETEENTGNDGNGLPENPYPDGNTDGNSQQTYSIRKAKVEDLFLKLEFGDVGNLYEEIAPSYNGIPISSLTIDELPTFAIQGNSGLYETILDYTDGYDIQLVSLAAAKGMANNKYKESIKQMLENKSFAKSPIVLDCFGNICADYENRQIVLIPASANKHLTTDPSINLLNSLIFNSNCGSTTDKYNLITKGTMNNGIFEKIWGWISTGIPPFGVATGNTLEGQPIIFFDTDTISVKYFKDGLKSSGEQIQSGDQTEILYTREQVDNMILEDLFKCDLNSNRGEYRFKINPVGLNSNDFKVKINDRKFNPYEQAVIANAVANASPSPNEEVLTTMLSMGNSKDRINFLGEPIVVNVGMGKVTKLYSKSGNIYKMTDKAYNKLLMNYLYNIYLYGLHDNAEGISITRDEARQVILNIDKLATVDINDSTLEGDSEIYIRVLKAFRADCLSTYLQGKKVDKSSDVKINNSAFGRTVKVYATSDVMQAVSNVLGVRDGTEFGVYASNIYLTYLDWYGVLNKTYSSKQDRNDTIVMGTKDRSKFNENIFDSNNSIVGVAIEDITDVISDEQKEKQVMDWAYLMLNPKEGRAYRHNMVMSSMEDWIYEEYQRIVYGEASTYQDGTTGVVTRNSTGFLAVPTFMDNPITGWFLKYYSIIAIVLIGIFFVLIVIVGLINKHKVSWFILNIIAMVSMVLILPTTGEIAPLVGNRVIQNLLTDKMSYWAISEGVQNACMERDAVNASSISSGYLNSLNSEERKQVVGIVKDMNVLYTDRCLNLKQDISKKVTRLEDSQFENIQQLRSARWMLPMMMRQFSQVSSGKVGADYVYVPLGDLCDDLSNMYWFYNPEEAKFCQTINAKQTVKITNTLPKVEYVQRYFPDYKDLNEGITEDIESNGTAELDVSGLTGGNSYRHISYYINKDKKTHTFSYMLPGYVESTSGDTGERKGTTGSILNLSCFSKSDNILLPYTKDYKSYDEWAKANVRNLVYANENDLDTTVSQNYKSIEAHIEEVADKYNRFDRETVDGTFGYLWMTESPVHYFYEGIKDSFLDDKSYGYIIGKLQGEYKTLTNGEVDPNSVGTAGEEESSGIEVRHSFMHDDSGLVKDILDLENMWYNVIPYMYSVQLGAEGYNEVAGVFDNEDMCNSLAGYEGNRKSWIFRSNWITKLMEGKEYRKSVFVGTKDGNRVKIENPMLASCYPEERPMVFSESQLAKSGLRKGDLSLVELKCIEINNNVSRKWTLLLNYTATKGMTKEVLMRQMAVDALFEFNEEFNGSGKVGTAYQLYPTGLDLRSISFDSIMKMLMINITHNTSYIYGDTMKTVISDMDTGTALLLLITSSVSATIMPFIRNLTLGFIFYWGLIAIVLSIFKTGKERTKLSVGYLTCNILFTLGTTVYYLLIKMLINVTTTDEILTVTQVEINTGNPVWCLWLVLGITVAYIIGLIALIVIVVRHSSDMGFELFASVARLGASTITGSVNGVKKMWNKQLNSATDYVRKRDAKKLEKEELRERKQAQKDKERQMDKNKNGNSLNVTSGQYNVNGGAVDLEDTSNSSAIDSEIARGESIGNVDKTKKKEHKKSSTKEINSSKGW